MHVGELLIMRHTHEVRLVNAPAIVGESVLLNLLPAEDHVRPITLRAIAPCVLWVLTLKDLEHIFQVLPTSFQACMCLTAVRCVKIGCEHIPCQQVTGCQRAA